LPVPIANIQHSSLPNFAIAKQAPAMLEHKPHQVSGRRLIGSIWSRRPSRPTVAACKKTPDAHEPIGEHSCGVPPRHHPVWMGNYWTAAPKNSELPSGPITTLAASAHIRFAAQQRSSPASLETARRQEEF